MEHIDEHNKYVARVNRAHKNHVKIQYGKFSCPRLFSEGDIVLIYDQDKYSLEEGKLKCMWLGPYIVTKVLKMDAYVLIDYEGNKLYTWALSKEVL